MIKRNQKIELTEETLCDVFNLLKKHVFGFQEIWKRDPSMGIETIYFEQPIQINIDQLTITITSGKNTVICLKEGDTVKYHGGNTVYVWKKCTTDIFRFYKIKGKYKK